MRGETHRVPDHQERFPGCGPGEIISRAPDLVSPPHRQPASSEDSSLLQLVDLGLREPGGGGSGAPLHTQAPVPSGDLKLQHSVFICSLQQSLWPPTLALLLNPLWSEYPESKEGNSLELFVSLQPDGCNKNLEMSDLISFSWPSSSSTRGRFRYCPVLINLYMKIQWYYGPELRMAQWFNLVQYCSYTRPRLLGRM